MPALLYRSKLPHADDPDIIEAVCRAVNLGHPLATAAAQAGICDQTLYDWLTEGKTQLAALGHQNAPWEELGSHARLVVCVKEAEAGLVEDGLQHVRAGGKDWAAWMTLLERRRPQDFGRFQRIEVSEERNITVRIELSPAAALALGFTPASQLVEGEVMSTPTSGESTA